MALSLSSNWGQNSQFKDYPCENENHSQHCSQEINLGCERGSPCILIKRAGDSVLRSLHKQTSLIYYLKPKLCLNSSVTTQFSHKNTRRIEMRFSPTPAVLGNQPGDLTGRKTAFSLRLLQLRDPGLLTQNLLKRLQQNIDITVGTKGFGKLVSEVPRYPFCFWYKTTEVLKCGLTWTTCLPQNQHPQPRRMVVLVSQGQMEEGDHEPKMQVASRSQKGEKMDSLLEPPERNAALPTP
ncbi:uncharacterized protein [Equus asinus]|uniref:uncharacterized protein n=1 Tax=Equus asinus TaxID=9793 RepID=UPI0038F5FF07